MPARALVVLIASIAYAAAGRAATLAWDTSSAMGLQGGSGNWVSSNWTNNGGFTNVAWSGGSDAVFSANPPGTATVNGATTTGSITFAVTGYTVSGSNTLTLSGADTIEVTNSGDSATISALIGGTAGWTKTGAGTLTFSGSTANSYSGMAAVADGTLSLSKSAGVNAITGDLTIGDASGAASSAIVTQGANNQIADSGVVRVNSDGFWNLASGNRSETIGGLAMGGGSIETGSGVLTLGGDVLSGNATSESISGLLNLGGATRFFIIDGAMDVSAAISNGGITLDTHSPSGSLTLSGSSANTYTGTTTVESGVLLLNKTSGVNSIAGNLVIGDGLDGGLPKLVRELASGQIATSSTVTLETDGEWDLLGHSETIAGLTLNGSAYVNASGTLTFNGNISASGGSISGHLNLGGATRVLDVSSGTLTIAAVISNGGMTKTNAGTLILSGANTFSGSVAVNGGTVQVSDVADSGANSNLGAGSSISFDGGALEFTAANNDSTNRGVTLNTGGGTISVMNATTTFTIAGAISGAGSLTKSGVGTLELAGGSANTYVGATALADGGLKLSKTVGVNAVPGDLPIGDAVGAAASAVLTQGNDEQIPNSATVTVNADGFWNLASGNHSETIAALVMNAGSIATGSGILTVNGNITTNANAASATASGQLNLGGVTRTIDVADGAATMDLDISAAISNGTGGLTKTGGGTLQLSGANSFSGAIALNAGTVIAHGGGAVSDSSDVTVASGATLSIDGNETIGSLAGAGTATITTGNTFAVAGSNSTTFSGSLSGAGGLTKSGNGTLTITNQPSYTGNTLISGGTLALYTGIASASGTITVNAPGTLAARSILNRAVTGNGTITATGTLFMGDANSTNGYAFGGTLNVGSNIVSLADADSAQLGVLTTLGNLGRLDAINGMTLASGRTISASANAAISGALVNNGTVNGPVTSGQSLTLLGDVSGTGNYMGHIDFSAHFSPGASPAAVSLENFTLDSTATLAMELGGTTVGSQYDQLNFTGTSVLGGMLNVSLINGFAPQEGNAFTLLAGGTISGTFSSIQLPAPLSGSLQWDASKLYTTGVISVVLPGDFDLNGLVNAADYVVWRKGLGTIFT
jgi:fibronectin-binding autotransporter adhesin